MLESWSMLELTVCIAHYDTICGLESYCLSFLFSEEPKTNKKDDYPVAQSSFGSSNGRIQTCPNEHGKHLVQKTGGGFAGGDDWLKESLRNLLE